MGFKKFDMQIDQNNMSKTSNNKETGDTLADALKEVQHNLCEARNIFHSLLRQENELKIEIFIRDTGLKVGTKVSFGSKSGVITRYSTEWGSVKPVITYFKKDGTLGKREGEPYSWDMKNLRILE